jgi:hypothetical protein
MGHRNDRNILLDKKSRSYRRFVSTNTKAQPDHKSPTCQATARFITYFAVYIDSQINPSHALWNVITVVAVCHNISVQKLSLTRCLGRFCSVHRSYLTSIPHPEEILCSCRIINNTITQPAGSNDHKQYAHIPHLKPLQTLSTHYIHSCTCLLSLLAHPVNRRHTDRLISITTLIDTSTAARLTPHTTRVTNVAHINTMATDYYLCAIVTNYEFRRQIINTLHEIPRKSFRRDPSCSVRVDRLT